jgi:serine-type D-Ala-D-Ala carboxypeptidase
VCGRNLEPDRGPAVIIGAIISGHYVEFAERILEAVDKLLREGLGTVYTAASVEVRQRGAVIYRAAVGSLDPDGQLDPACPQTRPDTLFDFASLTKLYTASAFFRLVDGGRVTLDAPVKSLLPGFTGPRAIRPYPDPLNPGKEIEVVPPTGERFEAESVTFCHLLTHSSGLPAWINLREADTEDARREMCVTTPFAYPTGTQVLYSDVGLILLGMAIEVLTDMPLDQAMKRLVQKPLDLTIRYGPIPPGNVAPTEFCAWRQRRIVGEVHDENSATLHGVAGHAGLFGTAADVATLGQVYLADGGGFISPRLAREATRLHIGDRGLGWMKRSPEGSSSGKYFSADSYGHTGFVGNSIWVDPQRQLVSVLLTNRVFFGRDPNAINDFRPRFHDTLIESLEGAA